MLYLGCVTGVLAGAAVAQARGLEPIRFAVATCVLLVPAFAGARLWFVAVNWPVFRSERGRAWRRGDGGWSVYGGLAGGFIASVPLLAATGIPLWRFWDAAAITMLVGLILTRLGCAMNGCCGGRETSGWLGCWLPDHNNAWRRRVPTQLLEAGWGASVLAGALIMQSRLSFGGMLFAAVVAAYGAGRLVLEPQREPTGPAAGRHANVAASVVLIVAGALALLSTVTAHHA
jgi:prolipoprotein diacylglyceryltransferase